MATFAELKTKKAKLELVKEKLKTDDRWVISGLLKIYSLQTEDEKNTSAAKVHNGVGFSGHDAEIMTSLAKQIIARGAQQKLEAKIPVTVSQFLSPKQSALLASKMQKYAGQLTRIAISNQR